ncbi:sensor histidine kinase KdpD [Butyrivibrio sp. INlla16]|uniref:sensor histidine kinase n=1 Tax=Butyrivibrio sp. INlla16 TaxID=1520807 RepID=UPI00088AF71C|nr:HAMP domain-containing sensor histidine kinase [Butyrivibrio sp. INlla16]SDB48728.1 Signal transduction histidine kinase [Butyrivibrio sp. INlla16]
MFDKIFRHKTMSWISRYILRIFQHICLAAVVALVFYIYKGSTFTGTDGVVYNLQKDDIGKEYADSELFNSILFDNLRNAVEFAAYQTLFETDGVYNGDKNIDVTAFINRNTVLQSDYITAVYPVSNLIKWSQNGFEYDDANFTTKESKDFLSATTVYTHLLKNNAEGGMNAFLNSQLENNAVRANVKEVDKDGAGSHTVLIPRYKTINGENIEDIVSGWDEYNQLCANITETASTMAAGYERYDTYKDKYSFYKSNFRYYITRTINARTEVFTNVDSLKSGTNGLNMKDVFKSYGRYIYYCPYDIEYSTNTQISEDSLRQLLGNYQYAFPDQMKFYFAIDINKTANIDDFKVGKEAFNRYMPYYRQLYIISAIFAVMYVIVLVHLSIYEGRIEYADGKVGGIERIDVIPIEIVFVFSLAVLGILFGLFQFAINNYEVVKYNTMSMSLLAGGLSFVGDNAICYAIYSIIRRAKAGQLYKTSLFKFIIGLIHKLFDKMTLRQNLFVRTVLPFLTSTLLNLYLILRWGAVGIVIVVVLDVAVAIYIINLNNDKFIILDALKRIAQGEIDVKVDVNKLHSSNVYFGEELNKISVSVEEAVNRSMRDEKLKADLITNVSHDIKTPLTSIINYVDLLKRENIDDPKVSEYIRILDNKSQRLRQLTDDLVEASKISSGNITLTMTELNFAEFVNQILGEFYEKFESFRLVPILKCEKYDVFIQADARQLYRVIENLLNNVCKYALPDTRVYMDLFVTKTEIGVSKAVFSVKNISKNELNINADELTERFIRGDISRSTEGSGLGLSIAKSLTTAMGGEFEIILDGDLFKVNVGFETGKFSNGNPASEKMG